MKNCLMIRLCLVVFCTMLLLNKSYAQIPQTVIRPILSQYVNSATPQVTPGIQYRLDAVDQYGAPQPYNYQYCNFVWTMTNGKDATNNTSTRTVAGTSQDVFIKWDNVNALGKIKVDITNLYSGATQSQVCPLGNNVSKEVLVPIEYFGDLENIRLNGNPITTTSLNCNTTPFTLSIPDPYTTNPYGAQMTYQWYVTGGQITSGQNTNTIQVTPSLNSDISIQVNVKRANNQYITKTKYATLVRPNPTNLSVSTFTQLCPAQTVTATATATNADGYEWTSTNGVYVNGSQNTGVIGSSVGLSANGTGSYRVRGYSSVCQSYSTDIIKYTDYGLPTAFFTVNSQTYNPNTNGQVCEYSYNSIAAVTSFNITGYNWSVSNPYQASFSGYGNQATFSPFASGYFYVSLDLTNSCGTSTSSLSFYAYTCYARYSVYPNPAKDYVSIEFDDIEDASSLPEEVELVNEESMKSLLLINVQEAYKSKQLKNGNSLELNVKEFARGTYYLRVKNSKRKEKTVDSIRLILE